MIPNKKAAMFGLDARIALAIFGALSVVSGAALYNIISHTKVVALVTDLQELGKAMESYKIDTGLMLIQKDSTTTTVRQAKWLVENSGAPGWNGPYTGYESISFHLNHNTYNYAHIFLLKEAGGFSPCDDVDPCYVWAGINGVPSTLAKKADLYVDGVDSIASGNLIYSDYSASIPDTSSVKLKIYVTNDR